jgi:hypothetical protein
MAEMAVSGRDVWDLRAALAAGQIVPLNITSIFRKEPSITAQGLIHRAERRTSSRMHAVDRRAGKSTKL